LQPYRVAYARFDRLTILEDIGQNSYKRERYQQMRARLAAVHRGSDDASAGKWVFLHRGGTAAGRLLENQADIEELLERLGFLIVDPAKLSAEEIVKACGGAEIVISVEGSQLAHPLYTMAPGGVLCALQPPYRLNNVFKDYADCIGLRYGLLTGEPAESGFRVSLDEIRELVDRLARSVTAHKSDEPAQGIPIDWIRKENREPGVSCR
jgi:hypothetical protein